FDYLFAECLQALIQHGRRDDARDLLDRYEAGIPGKSAQYINLCNIRCYYEWYGGNHDVAVRWGMGGQQLKRGAQVDTRFSTDHNLALARRDLGDLKPALEYFVEGQPIEIVLKVGELIPDKTPPFYGNIGRCLFLDGKLEEALICYRKSAHLLEQ